MDGSNGFDWGEGIRVEWGQMMGGGGTDRVGDGVEDGQSGNCHLRLMRPSPSDDRWGEYRKCAALPPDHIRVRS